MNDKNPKVYFEDFDSGPGGWVAWGQSHAAGPRPVQISQGAVISSSPWWVDYNHAPPGAGYLHITMFLCTSLSSYQNYRHVGGENRFLLGKYGTDFSGARLTLRLKGNIDLRGAQLLLLAQTRVHGLNVNQVLTAQPFQISGDWSAQTVILEPDASQWTSTTTL